MADWDSPERHCAAVADSDGHNRKPDRGNVHGTSDDCSRRSTRIAGNGDGDVCSVTTIAGTDGVSGYVVVCSDARSWESRGTKCKCDEFRGRDA